VGYGDQYPVTSSGRAVGAVLLTTGVALFSVLTGYLANALRERRKARVLDASDDSTDPSARVMRIQHALEQHEAAIRDLRHELDDVLRDMRTTSGRSGLAPEPSPPTPQEGGPGRA
jgi:uncharacterized protein YlxW (UPF0749 family)